MLTEFIEQAMKNAKYEKLEGNEGYYAEIPGFDGVWANAGDLETCRNELKETLEEWILLKVRKRVYVPTTKSYDLNKVLCER